MATVANADLFVRADGSNEVMIFVGDRSVIQVCGEDTQEAYLVAQEPTDTWLDQGFSTGWEA